MSSRKNDYGADALDYIEPVDLEDLDKRIQELEDEVDKLNRINATLRDQLMSALGLTE